MVNRKQLELLGKDAHNEIKERQTFRMYFTYVPYTVLRLFNITGSLVTSQVLQMG